MMHGITHLSCSSLNLWRASPGIWALQYLAKVKDAGGPSMWRGTAVENGLAAFLRKGDPVATALTSFEMNAQGEASEEVDAERQMIGPMLEQLTKWQPPSDLNATQLRIEHYLDDVSLPLIGYLDFAFDGIDVDLKTTKSLPSVPRPDHVRQVSLYRAARGREGGLLYVTPKKFQFYPVDDDMMERSLNDLRSDAMSLIQFLARCNSVKDALSILPIDQDHFRYPKTKVPLNEILSAG